MARPAVPMPKVVRAAVAAELVLAAVALWGVGPSSAAVLPAVLGGLLVRDTARGQPTAWQTGRFVGLVVMYASIPWFVFAAPSETPVLLATLSSFVAGAVLVVGLSRPDARRFFDLYCGHCRTSSFRAVHFWLGLVRCRKCGRRWAPHSSRVDPSVFE